VSQHDLKHECGVFGAYNIPHASNLCFYGLYAVQHRGQEGAGIVTQEKSQFFVVKDAGLVSDTFNKESLAYLKGNAGIGHVRYSTTGGSDKANIQPMYSKTMKGKIAIAHNGNITNAYKLYNELKKNGALFQSTVDSEVILHLFAKSTKKSAIDAMLHTLQQLEGAFSLVALGDGYLMAARDSNGFRPLVLGKLGKGYVVASETCAFDLIEAEYIREIEPGELVYIDQNGLQSFRIAPPLPKLNKCIFEHVYFARPDTLLFGENVYLTRKEMGRYLARQAPVDADIVIGVPDSGNSAALGYAEEIGLPFELGITRNHYVGRTFIQPKQRIRSLGVKVKLNPVTQLIAGKRLVVVDDSLVRGTTSKERVSALRRAGAKEIHLRISSPPIIGPCFYGIDTPTKDQLIATQKTVAEICKFIGADSLEFLTVKHLLASVKDTDKKEYCTSCFTGKYPVKVTNKGKKVFESRKERIQLYGKT
jgi:amidophosphoribosyltransferase